MVKFSYADNSWCEAQHRYQILDKQCYISLHTGYRPGSFKNLKFQAHIYLNFCRMHKLALFPADSYQMVRFARYIGNTVVTVGTVQNYAGGVRKLHDLGGFKVPDSGEPSFKLIIQALRFELAKPTKQAKAMTPQLLRQIYNHVDLNKPLEVVCYTAILIGFYLFLRKSNLVPDSSVTFNPEQKLARGDVFIAGWLVVLDIRWSKTIQYKEKELLLPLIPAKCQAICPIYLIWYMLMSIPWQPQDPLFSVPKKGRNIALNYEQLRKLLAKWVAMTGEDPEGYTPHCLRRGRCTHALNAGLAGEDIQLIGIGHLIIISDM